MTHALLRHLAAALEQTPLRVRPVEAADAAILHQILAGSFGATVAALPPPMALAMIDLQIRARQAEYDHHWPTRERLVLLTEEAAAGWLEISPRGDPERRSLHVIDVALLPALQGRGLGRRLRRKAAEVSTFRRGRAFGRRGGGRWHGSGGWC